MNNKIIAVVSASERAELHSPDNGIYLGTRFSTRNPVDGFSPTKHFGNPFRTNDNAKWMSTKYNRKVKGFGDTTTVSRLFVKWIKGEEYKHVEPERRIWIRGMIDSGILDDAKFLYHRIVLTGTSHLHELIRYIQSVKTIREAKLYNFVTGLEEVRESIKVSTTMDSTEKLKITKKIVKLIEFGKEAEEVLTKTTSQLGAMTTKVTRLKIRLDTTVTKSIRRKKTSTILNKTPSSNPNRAPRLPREPRKPKMPKDIT